MSKVLWLLIMKKMTDSSPRCPIQSHSLVHSENNSYFFGIRPIGDVDLTCKFRPEFPPCM